MSQSQEIEFKNPDATHPGPKLTLLDSYHYATYKESRGQRTLWPVQESQLGQVRLKWRQNFLSTLFPPTAGLEVGLLEPYNTPQSRHISRLICLDRRQPREMLQSVKCMQNWSSSPITHIKKPCVVAEGGRQVSVSHWPDSLA